MSERRLREAMAALGFSEKEVEAYLAVLARGTATMRTVSEAASVSQSYVYEIASDLADRGLLTVDESTSPTVLRARPPAEVVDALTEQVASYESAAEALYSQADHTEPGFEVLQATKTVRRRLVRHVEAAERELVVVLPGDAIAIVREELAAAVDRGVLVYCMVTSPDLEAAVDALDAGAHAHVVRSFDAAPPVIAIRDVTGGILGGHGTLTGAVPHDEVAVAFDQRQVGGGLFGNAVANVWPMGRQRAVAGPPDLPATFEHFRSGVTTAALHDRAGASLVADVDAVEIDSGEARSFEGVPVREVRQSLVEPRNCEFPLESALIVEAEEGRVSVAGGISGIAPWFEEYAAERVTLRRAGDCE